MMTDWILLVTVLTFLAGTSMCCKAAYIWGKIEGIRESERELSKIPEIWMN